MSGPGHDDFSPPMSDLPPGEFPTPRPPRRPRYAGKNPRRFDEKYKEHDPAKYPEDVAKIVAVGLR